MKYLFSFVLLFLMLCSCKSDKIVLLVGGVKKVFDRFDPNAPPPKLPPPPDKPLKEIKLFGWYGSEFFVFKWKAYCYKEEQEKNKGFPYIKKKGAIYDNGDPYKENELVAHDTLLQARLYTKEDKLLVATNLRCDTIYSSPDKCLGNWGPFLDIYIPYFKEAYKLKIIKIEEGKEVTLGLNSHFDRTEKERGILSYEEIRKLDYAEENDCHNVYLSYTR